MSSYHFWISQHRTANLCLQWLLLINIRLWAPRSLSSTEPSLPWPARGSTSPKFTCLLGVCDRPSLGDLDCWRSGDSQSAWVPLSSELQRETSGESRCFLSLDLPLSLPPERWVSDLWPVKGNKKKQLFIITQVTLAELQATNSIPARDWATVNWLCPFRIQYRILTSSGMETAQHLGGNQFKKEGLLLQSKYPETLGFLSLLSTLWGHDKKIATGKPTRETHQTLLSSWS